MVLVLLFHAGVPQMAGGFVGVDVFFVISGFLITGTILREVRATGSLSLLGFYARRIRRLLPAATTVLLFTIGLAKFGLPAVYSRTFSLDAAAAATYFVNWRLAGRSVDYLAEDVGPSPVQHFWSLSIEEQFYFFWPLLILLAIVLSRRYKWRQTPAITGVLGLVATSSFIWSVSYTSSNGQLAFFSTATRVWELAIGAALAIAAPRLLAIPPKAATALGWGGLLAVLASGVFFGSGSPWPGSSALLPTAGTAFIISAGVGGKSHLSKILALRPAVWLGGISYPLYLWHWPLLLLARQVGLDGVVPGLAVVALAVIPSWATKKLIEDPIRYSPTLLGGSNLLSVAIGISLTATVVAISLAAAGAAPPTQSSSDLSGRGLDPTFAIQNPTADYEEIRPRPIDAAHDFPEAYALGCQVRAPDPDPIICIIGDIQSTYRIAVVGDSKILQWYSALDAIGKQNKWRFESITKAGCSFSSANQLLDGKPYEECVQWNESTLALLVENPPAAILTSQSAQFGYLSMSDTGEPVVTREAAIEGLRSRWSELEAIGINVIVLLDNPHPPTGVPRYQCVSENPADPTVCDFSRSAGVERSGAIAQLPASVLAESVNVIDMTNYICNKTNCPVIVGTKLVYRQAAHLSDTYAREIGFYLGEELKRIVESIR